MRRAAPQPMRLRRAWNVKELPTERRKRRPIRRNESGPGRPRRPRAIPNGVETLMATTVNKQRLVNQLLSQAKKAAAQDPSRTARPVLEEFVYALCRENASREQADRA